jgi:hypothetical protein
MRPVILFFAATAVLSLLGPPARGQTLNWDLERQKDATCLYGTVTVLATQPGTYYCGAKWRGDEPAFGSCGIQHLEKEHRTILSVRDTSPKLHAKTMEADADTLFHGVGGEGEGEHTSRVWPWKTGESFEFFLQKQNTTDGKSTDVRYYVYDRGSRRWRHVSTIRNPVGGQKSVKTIGGAVTSFMENLSGKNGDLPKLALYRLWLGTSVDELKPLTKATGNNYWGQLNDAYFLAEGADKKLETVFRGLEGKYGKPVYGSKGDELPPITAKPIPAEVVKALNDLPRADEINQLTDDARDDGAYVIRNVSTRKGFVIGKGGKVSQHADGKARVVWRLKQVGDYYLIINTATNLVLDGSESQTILVRATGAAGQLWSFEKVGIAYHIRCKEKGRVLELAGGELDGTPIVVGELKKPPEDWNQLWLLDDLERSADPRAGGTYTIRSVLSRKYAAFEKPPGEDGSSLIQLLTNKPSVWKLEKDGDSYRIVNSTNGLVLDAAEDQIAQRKANGSASQLWTFVKVGKAYHVRCKETGRVLDVSGESKDDGTAIIAWPLKDPPTSNQLWMLADVKKK